MQNETQERKKRGKRGVGWSGMKEKRAETVDGEVANRGGKTKQNKTKLVEQV